MLNALNAFDRATNASQTAQRVEQELQRLAPLVEQASLEGKMRITVTPRRTSFFRYPEEIKFSQALGVKLRKLGYSLEPEPELSGSFTLDWSR